MKMLESLVRPGTALLAGAMLTMFVACSKAPDAPTRPAAASTAALLSGKVRVEPGETVVAVVSGGNIAAKQAAAILAT